MNPDVGPTDIDGFSRIKPPLKINMQTSWYGTQKTVKTCRFGSDVFPFSIGRDFELPAVKLQFRGHIATVNMFQCWLDQQSPY